VYDIRPYPLQFLRNFVEEEDDEEDEDESFGLLGVAQK